ncbi:MAG: hypothetical protein OXH13_06695 [Chloroflexi bacterium]|nr:hypothetical protein [Chloroflexota bacterium]MCY3696502.1 hypothetical protein [Chloroflexota bacterium]
MEHLDLNSFRLVLDGPPAVFPVAVITLLFLGVPTLVATIGAVVLDFISIRKGVAVIVAWVVLWFVAMLIVSSVT